MDFKQLRSFVAVVDCGSFTKAAARLYTSQPTVSAHIRQLEDELHERLFLRTTKSLAITPRGRELYEYAAHVLSLQDRLLSSWSEDQHLIRLGSSTIPSAYILPELLPQYRRLHPEATFAIHQSDSADVLDGLRKGQFELALVGMEEPEEDLAFTPFYRDSMVLITPNTAYFSALSPDGATVAELLRSQPLLLREPGSGSQRSVDVFSAASAWSRPRSA